MMTSLHINTVVDRPPTPAGAKRLEEISAPFDHQTECPRLVEYVEHIPDGDVFTLYGNIYRRQTIFRSGDVVLYLTESDKLYLAEDGRVLIDGRMVTKHYRGLCYAKLENMAGYARSEYRANGEHIGLLMQELFPKKLNATRNTVLAVRMGVEQEGKYQHV